MEAGRAVCAAGRQQYGLTDEDLADLEMLGNDEDLHVEIVGEGWYGHRTTMVQVWN